MTTTTFSSQPFSFIQIWRPSTMRPQTRESYIAENDSKGMESLLVCSGCRENADRQA